MSKRFEIDYPTAPSGMSQTEWDTRLQLAAWSIISAGQA